APRRTARRDPRRERRTRPAAGPARTRRRPSRKPRQTARRSPSTPSPSGYVNSAAPRRRRRVARLAHRAAVRKLIPERLLDLFLAVETEQLLLAFDRRQQVTGTATD